MKNKKGVTPFELDPFTTRGKRTDNLYKPDNIYAKSFFSNLAVMAFVFIDFFTLFQVWNLVQTENPLYVYCVAFGCAVALDVPLAIAAIALKRYHDRMSSKLSATIICSLSIIVFAIAFVFSLMFRLVTKELTFDIGTSSTITNIMTEQTVNSDDKNTILYAALFNGMIPLLTSISSFVISYFSYDPVNARLYKKEKERIALQSNIIKADVAIAQAEDAETYCRKLLYREDDLYNAEVEKLKCDSNILRQLARMLIMEKLQNASNVTTITESAKDVNEQAVIDERQGTRFTDYIEEKCTAVESE